MHQGSVCLVQHWPVSEKKYGYKKKVKIVNDGIILLFEGACKENQSRISFFLSRICSSTNFWSTIYRLYAMCIIYARFAYYIFRLKRKSIVSSNRIHAWQLHWGGSHKRRLLPVIKSRWPYSTTATSDPGPNLNQRELNRWSQFSGVAVIIYY